MSPHLPGLLSCLACLAARSPPRLPRSPPLPPLAPPAGFLASAAYQALYTLPNWDRLVAQRMAASGTSPRYLVALLALFGALFNLHMLVQAAVFKTEGAIGVGLVNAVRGAVITVTVAALFCSPARPHLCLTPQTILSAAITTVGGAVYVLAGSGQQPPQPAKAAAHGAAAEDKKDK